MITNTLKSYKQQGHMRHKLKSTTSAKQDDYIIHSVKIKYCTGGWKEISTAYS